MKKLPSVNQMIETDSDFDKKKLELFKSSTSLPHGFREELQEFIETLEEKINSLTGEKNIRKLERIFNKWEEFLNQNLPEESRLNIELINRGTGKEGDISKLMEDFVDELEETVEYYTENSTIKRPRFNFSLFKRKNKRQTN